MTVAELIDHLKIMPQDAPVIYSYHSDYADLEAREVTHEQMIRRNDHWMRYIPHHWDKAKDGEPVLIDVCCFPGN